jgi:hypothetical protein
LSDACCAILLLLRKDFSAVRAWIHRGEAVDDPTALMTGRRSHGASSTAPRPTKRARMTSRFLLNSALSPRANWSTLGPPLARAMERRGFETHCPKPLSPRSAAARLLTEARGGRSVDTDFWMQLSSRPEWPLVLSSLAAGRVRRSAYVIDAWPYRLKKIATGARLMRLAPCFVAFREAYDQLVASYPEQSFVHLPFGVDTDVFHPAVSDERDVFAYWMGRRTPALHDALAAYCADRGLVYRTSEAGEVSDPHELGALVARSRYFVVTTPDVDHPERAGGFSPLVMRYLEGLACDTRLLGTVPRSGEFAAMLPADGILEVKPDGSDLAARLDADQVNGPTRPRMAEIGAYVRQAHSWDARAATVVAALER